MDKGEQLDSSVALLLIIEDTSLWRGWKSGGGVLSSMIG